MVEPLQQLHALRLVVGLVGLGLAAYLDLKTRRVPNRLWWVLALAAGGLWVAEMVVRQRPWEHLALLGPLAVFFAYAFVDPSEWPLRSAKRLGWHSLEAAALVVLGWLVYGRLVLPGEGGRDWDFAVLLAVPLLMGVMVGAYYAGLMVGGADVKALMTVALLAPTYPDLVPWELLTVSEGLRVPFPFVVFANSLLCYLAVPLVLLVWNLAHRSWGPPWVQMFFGYQLDIEAARRRFVWPMERVVAMRSAEVDINEASKGEKMGEGTEIEARPEEDLQKPPSGPEDETPAPAPAPQSTNRQRIAFELFVRNRGDSQEVLDRLEAAGRTEVWVTPKTPYMVPLAAAWLVSFLVGDLFFNLMVW